jgi:DNA-binding response OmpR family regulator
MPKVLIVDDNPDILEWFVALFGGSYDLVCCSSLDSVKSRWSDEICLCLLDHNLGDGEPNGAEIAQWIRTNDTEIPIAWLTTSRNEAVYSASLEVNAISFLTKPMDFDEISDTFSRYVP